MYTDFYPAKYDIGEIMTLAKAHGYSVLNVDYRILNDTAAASARTYGVEFSLWTIDDPEKLPKDIHSYQSSASRLTTLQESLKFTQPGCEGVVLCNSDISYYEGRLAGTLGSLVVEGSNCGVLVRSAKNFISWSACFISGLKKVYCRLA